MEAPITEPSSSLSFDDEAEKHCCPVNLAAHRTEDFSKPEAVLNPIVGSNFAVFDR